MPPTGNPPPTILPRIVRSGRHAVELLGAATGHPEAGHHLVEDRAAHRAASASRRSASRKPGAGGTHPMLPATGSTMIARDALAVRSRRPRRRRRGRCTAATSVSAVTPVGTPGVDGMPRVVAPDPALDEQRVDVAVVAPRELDDPVAAGGARASAERAHGGLGAGVDTCAPSRWTGRRRRSRSASSISASVGAPKVVPRSAAPRGPPSTISGSAWPRISGPQDADVVEVPLAVDVLDVRPLPRAEEQRLAEADGTRSRGPAS